VLWELLSNVWFVTIVGGVLSFLLVRLLTRVFQSFPIAIVVAVLAVAILYVFGLILFKPSVAITNPLPPDTATVELSKGGSHEGIFRVSGTISNVKLDFQKLYLLATDQDNPNTWYIFTTEPPINGRWSAEIPAGNVWNGKRTTLVADVTDPSEVYGINPGKDGARTVSNPDDLNPKVQSKPVVIILGPLKRR
jgi:hypothetical protein